MSTSTTDTDRAMRDEARRAAAAEVAAEDQRRAAATFAYHHNGMSPSEWASALAAPRRHRDGGYEAYADGGTRVGVFYYEHDTATPYAWTAARFVGGATEQGDIASIHERLANGQSITVPADAPDFPASIRATIKRICEHVNTERERKAEEERKRAEEQAQRKEADRRMRLTSHERTTEDLAALVPTLIGRIEALESQIAGLTAAKGSKP